MITVSIITVERLNLKREFDFFFVKINISGKYHRLFIHRWFQDNTIDLYPKINQSFIIDNSAAILQAITIYFNKKHL